jgi:hypothetical protein
MAHMVTVALPLFNSGRIAWLALESLCRQVNAPQWELRVCEEQNDLMLGEDGVLAYAERLTKSGCRHISYTPLQEWIPLALKWRLMAKEAGGEVFVLQAADCYSPPNRLRTSSRLLQENGAHWVHQQRGLFLDLRANRKAMYVHPSGQPTALNMATLTRLLRNLPEEHVRKGVDRWLFNHAVAQCRNHPLRTVFDPTEDWKHGIDTHGLNNISKKRGAMIMSTRGAFQPTDLRPRDVLPADILERLTALSKELRAEERAQQLATV